MRLIDASRAEDDAGDAYAGEFARIAPIGHTHRFAVKPHVAQNAGCAVYQRRIGRRLQRIVLQPGRLHVGAELGLGLDDAAVVFQNVFDLFAWDQAPVDFDRAEVGDEIDLPATLYDADIAG